jgi:hypothetical protein
MSLINDALKKAARQRTEEQGELPPSPLSSGRKRIPRHGAPMTVQTLMLIIGGAAVLVIGSVVVTVILVTGKSESKLAQEARAAPVVAVTPTPQPPPVVAVSVPVEVRKAVPVPTAEPVAQAAPSPTPAPVVAVAKPVAPPRSRAEQVQSFVDALRVTGVRLAGAESKVLVDGHVYRVNDTLERTLGIRLVAVDADHLTLADAAGATYVKNF